MKQLSTIGAAVTAIFFSIENAQKVINSTKYTGATAWNSAGNGPFDLGIVYPLFSSSGVPNPNSAALTCNYPGGGTPYFHSGFYVFTGTIPAHIIYYGSSGISSTQKTVIEDLVGNIGYHSYWNAVTGYYNEKSKSAAVIYKGTVAQTGCVTGFSLNGCNLQNSDPGHIM